MKTLILNILSKDQGVLRKNIFTICKAHGFKRREISEELSTMEIDGLIKSELVEGEFYDVTSYQLV